MATHPPITERIKAIDPSWDGKFPPLSAGQAEFVKHGALSEFEEAAAKPSFLASALGEEQAAPLVEREPVFASRSEARPFPPPPMRAGFGAQSVLPNTGNPTTAHLRYAEDLRNAIPDSLKLAARETLGASTLVYALLLSDDETVRRKQFDELARATFTGVCQETQRIFPEVQPIATQTKLPLVDLALPGLRQMSPSQFQQFRAAVQTLVESDGEIDLFEYVLQKIVLRHLEPQFVQARKPLIQYYALKPLAPDCGRVLSALAHVGQDDLTKAEAAFRQGAQFLSYAAQAEIPFVNAEQCDLSRVDEALNRLTQAAPQIKKNLLNACAQTVAADGVIQEMEAEMIRAIADTLDCPMPPMLAAA